MAEPYGYKEKVDDEQLVNLIEAGIQNSVGDWLNSSDLTRERLRSTYEFAGVPHMHFGASGRLNYCRYLHNRGSRGIYCGIVRSLPEQPEDRAVRTL